MCFHFCSNQGVPSQSTQLQPSGQAVQTGFPQKPISTGQTGFTPYGINLISIEIIGNS